MQNALIRNKIFVMVRHRVIEFDQIICDVIHINSFLKIIFYKEFQKSNVRVVPSFLEVYTRRIFKTPRIPKALVSQEVTHQLL